MAKTEKRSNPYLGSNFDDFLKDEGIFDEVHAKALKRALAEQLEDSMISAKLTKVAMAEKMATSRSQLDRVLDPDNLSVQLDTLIRAARAVGKDVEIRIKRPARRSVVISR
jgi:antitoxin HicB